MTLTDFLLARIAEDETVARTATTNPWSVSAAGVAVMADDGSGRAVEIVVVPDDFPDDPDVRHIARHDPTRVLAECEAKRRIVERSIDSTGVTVANDWPLYFLALPYADHPEYREEWKP